MHAARQMYDGGITITGAVRKEPRHTYCLVCWNYLKAVTALYGASSTPRPVSKLRYFLRPMCREALSLPTYREREIRAGRPIACANTIDYRRRWNSAWLDCHPHLFCEGNWGIEHYRLPESSHDFLSQKAVYMLNGPDQRPCT